MLNLQFIFVKQECASSVMKKEAGVVLKNDPEVALQVV
jgi:hypothetical protein